ncbi:hypothetical protein [Paenarthrobacter sp. AMU7]|uniref:ApeA N-terminal domain-containing protein n=1 Tax=Paenarthrobacter sp. AMU7 TaxID=3162492 RepID=A0AB39YUK5_9MICC
MREQSTPEWEENSTYTGSWWAPDCPELAFHGNLEFKGRKPELRISADVFGQHRVVHGKSRVVHGKLETGEKLTLWDLSGHPLRSLYNGDNGTENVKTFTYAILGDHLAGPEETRLRYSAYRMRGLGTWAAIDAPIPYATPYEELPNYHPVVLSIPDDETDTEYLVEVRIENPRRLEAEEGNSYGVISSFTGEDARIVFACEPPAPARIHDLLLFDMQALLTFSYQGGAPIESEWLALGNLDDQLNVMREDAFTGHPPTEHIFRDAMVLTTAALEPRELLPAWWRVVEELYPATQVITLYHHGPHGVLENSVSSVIAMLENLHAKIGPTTTRFEQGFLRAQAKPLKAALRSAFPGNEYARFREFMYEALQNDRPTLEIRLEELVSAATPERLALMHIDPTQWIEDVRLVRNPLAHTSSHVGRRGGGNSVVLRRVNAQSRAIATMLVLGQMGLGSEALDIAATALSRKLQHLQPQ